MKAQGGYGMSLMDENSGQNDASINNMIPSKLFPGYIGELLFHYALGVKVPKQLDRLDFFYPGLIIMEEPVTTAVFRLSISRLTSSCIIFQ
jgi:hypothetical protein